jgi:predicted transcriptional regulator
MNRRAIRVAKGELEILSLLWDAGPLTIGDAHRRYAEYGQPVSYPTMQTRLNRMVEKGLLARSHIKPSRYSALATRNQVTRGHLRELVANISGGDVVPLVAHLLTQQTLTKEQIADLQQLLAKAEHNTESGSQARRKS